MYICQIGGIFAKNIGWNKKLSWDWGLNRGQLYPITCFQGQYIGWKGILHPEKIGLINIFDY